MKTTENNNQLLLWTSKGATAEGIPTPDELKKTPGYPSLKRLQEGPVAIIECIEEIPCDPCETACPAGAIKIGAFIINLPVLDEDKCTGCGVCISSCPGLAIFVLHLNYTNELALISFPFEFLPLPRVGEEVSAVDREGKEVCKGKVVKILNKTKQNRTPVLSISIPKKYPLVVRGISVKKDRSSKQNNSPKNVNNENKMRVLDHPILGRQSPGKMLNITVDGKKIKAREGEMIIAALLNAEIRVNRFTSKYNEPRGIFCGIGQCTDCIMTVNSVPNVRTCVTPVEEGMVIETQYGRGKWGVKS
ncbi:MAG: 2Fe-2S iron-sulfur cluster-binding protein [bacterium]